MSFGFGFALPHWKTLSGGFTPASLFTGGENGVWYEPSPTNGTLFQDSAGITPVTGVEQFVGLMLDKSKGLVLGPELVTNGDFSSGTTGWSVLSTATMTASGGGLLVSRGGATFVSQPAATINLVAGKTYQIVGQVTVAPSVGNASIGIFGADRSTERTTPGVMSRNTAGVLTSVFTASVTEVGYIIIGIAGSSTGTVTYDNISVRELPGNHAFQTNSTKRPKLAARYNLLTYTEEFDNPYWLKGSPADSAVSADQTTAPNGTPTADLVTELATTSGHILGSGLISFTAGTTYTASCYVKNAPGGRGFFQIGFFQITAASANAYVNFDIVNGSVTDSSNATGSITDAGNGWFRCVVTVTSGRTYSERYNLVLITNGTAGSFQSYLGDITKGLYVWGADLRPASQATGLIGPTYQRVAAATVYDTAGFLPYLAFDGLDWHMTMDSLVSGTSYFEGANAPFTMFAGARRNTTGSFMSIVALCDNTNATPSNNDQLILGFRDVTTQVVGETRDVPNIKPAYAGTNAAPQTNVITWDRISTNGVARVDGVAGTPADQTQPALGLAFATIGAQRRDPTPTIGNYLNGWLYSLIVRGAQSTQSQIEATEAWVNGKTGAY